jgi:hypothetical protein
VTSPSSYTGLGMCVYHLSAVSMLKALHIVIIIIIITIIIIIIIIIIVVVLPYCSLPLYSVLVVFGVVAQSVLALLS